jgi:L-rhamnose mutarotase
MTTDDAVFDAGRFARATVEDPVIARWEALMWTFQAPTPWTPAGDKWTPMRPIFDWSAASA